MRASTADPPQPHLAVIPLVQDPDDEQIASAIDVLEREGALALHDAVEVAWTQDGALRVIWQQPSDRLDRHPPGHALETLLAVVFERPVIDLDARVHALDQCVDGDVSLGFLEELRAIVTPGVAFLAMLAEILRLPDVARELRQVGGIPLVYGAVSVARGSEHP